MSSAGWERGTALAEGVEKLLDETRAARQGLLETDRSVISDNCRLPDASSPLRFLPTARAAFRLFIIEGTLCRKRERMREAVDAYCDAVAMARLMGVQTLSAGAAPSLSSERAVWVTLRSLAEDIPEEDLHYMAEKTTQIGQTRLSLDACLHAETDLLNRSLTSMSPKELAEEFKKSGIALKAPIDRQELSADLASYELRAGEWLESGLAGRHYQQEPRPKMEALNGWLPYLGSLWVLKQRTVTDFRLTLLSILLNEYWAEHGRFPDDLALVSKNRGNLHIDPFADGLPLRYLRRADGCVIYSVGPDGDDDRGEVVYGAKRTLADGDIVCSIAKNEK